MSDDIALKIGGDTSKLNDALSQGSKKIDQFVAKAKKMSAPYEKAAKRAAAVGAAVVGAAGGIAAFTKSAANSSRELQNFTRVANTTTTEFQALAMGAEQYGISNEKLADQLKDVNDRVGDFLSTGGGPMADFFENIAPKVGVTAEQFQKLSGPQALQLYISSLEKAGVNQQQMTFYLEAMASDLTNLSPLFADNGRAIEENRRKIDSLGLTISGLDHAQLNELNKTFSVMKTQANNAKIIIGAKLAPWITEMSNRLLTAGNSSMDFGDAVEDSFSKAMKVAGFLGDMLHTTKGIFLGIQLVAESAGSAIMTVFELAAKAVSQYFIDPIIADINRVITHLNKIKGIDLDTLDFTRNSESMQKFEQMASASRERISQLRGELHNFLSGPMPSDGVEQMMANVEERTARMKLLVQDGILGGNEEEREETIAKLDENLQRVNETHAQHQERLAGLFQRGQQDQNTWDELTMRNKVQVISGALTSITSGVAQHNKKLFQLNKVAAIAEAVINAYKGISLTMSTYPYPYNLALSAAHAAAAFAQINAIRSQSFNGGGRGMAPTQTGTTPQVVTQAGDSGGGSDQMLRVEAFDTNALFTGGVMRNLAETIGEHVRNGGDWEFV